MAWDPKVRPWNAEHIAQKIKSELSNNVTGGDFMLKILINRDMPEFCRYENMIYRRVCLFEAEVGDSIVTPPSTTVNELSIQDSEVLQIGLTDPANHWALQNCLDRMLYVRKQFDHAIYAAKLWTSVYLTDEQKTFWLLKSNQ